MYHKAANAGYIEALTNLADFLSDGKGCKKDLKKAIKIYLLAIEKGSDRAAFNLGTIYRDKGNFKKALEYYLLANKIDKTNYSFTIALCYYYGIGIDSDKKKACRIFLQISINKLKKYSQAEIDEANYLLGLAYLKGDGIKTSLMKARHFLKLADTDFDHQSAEELLFIIGK